MDYPNRLRELRKARGLSQERLADLVNTSKTQIRRLELGQRRLTLDWMNRIAPHLNAAPADLLPECKGYRQSAPTCAELEQALLQALPRIPRGTPFKRARYVAEALARILNLPPGK